MEMMSIVVGALFATLVAVGIKIISGMIDKQWNIPVIILRFVGNKGRPNIIITRARKENKRGATRLFVKGRKIAIKDFRSELYFPSPGKPYGGLILFEVDDGLLTPCIPSKHEKDPQLRQAIDEAIGFLNEQKHVKFSYSDELYNDIKLKAVDDTDIDWMIDEIVRVKTEYKTGFLNFLQNIAPYIMLAIVCIAIIVGMVLFFKEAPNLAQECLDTAFSKAGEMCNYQQAKAVYDQGVQDGTIDENNPYIDKLIPKG